MRSVVLLSGWLALTMAGCAEEAVKHIEAFTIGDDCTDPGGCPTNSPVIATYKFHDLNVDGAENVQGFKIEKFQIGPRFPDFSVEDGRIVARTNGAVYAEGAGLVGGKLWLRHNTNTYIMLIAEVRTVGMWARIDPAQPRQRIEVYHLKWITHTGGAVPPDGPPWKNICDDVMLPANSIELDLPAPPDGSTGTSTPSAPNPASDTYIPNFVTFVFEGERINAATRKIDGFDKAWFNLACAGHLLSKMHLMGHVAATESMGYVTTIPERQAIMKMFSADYCGTGKAFTVPGVTLQWHDHRGWLDYFPSPVPDTYAVEARWTDTGATCLNVPRAAAHSTADSRARFPDGIDVAIANECVKPPPCNPDPEDFAGAHLITVNP
jgi:hypothetical protein